MKIKDVEKRTGITSYNIRFYEKENLLIPKRNPVNGCKLCLNGMPVPLLRNCYSIFNGTKYR